MAENENEDRESPYEDPEPQIDPTGAPVMGGGPESDGEVEKQRPGWERQLFMIIVSALIVGTIAWLVYRYGEKLYGEVSEDPRSLLPYLATTGGVLLFVLNTARKKGKDWQLRNFIGDQVFRIAQAWSYTFILQWAWYAANNETSTGAELPPVFLGFFIGLFILRVERAMEGVGDRFESMLTAIVPRSIARPTPEDRRRASFKDRFRLDDVQSQYEALRPQIEDPRERAVFESRLVEARKQLDSEEPKDLGKLVEELSFQLDDIKRNAGITLVPLEDLVSKR